MGQKTGVYQQNKRKIINDPVYGLITLPHELIFELVEHPYVQRLRRIMQLGLTYYVYPAAVHNRFQHALGATHLMNTALDVIQKKGCELDEEDRIGALLAILLHDVGHGPFSHATEHVFVKNLSHESLSLQIMHALNKKFSGALDAALNIFTGSHPKTFLHQLVSSQLDMDRLDYLRRDSYFTGVTEGVVGSDRIIKMLRVYEGQLVVDRKGIYSIEKYLISRRLMYWQVYLHKTVIAAEQLLIKTLLRARFLADAGEQLFASPALATFLFTAQNENLQTGTDSDFLEAFSQLDDADVISALKAWSKNKDRVLSMLAYGLLHRKLPAIRIQDRAFDEDKIQDCRQKTANMYDLDEDELGFLVYTDGISSSAYNEESDQVMLYENTGRLTELSEASDIINPKLLSRAANKYFLCFPKEFSEYF